MPDKWKVLIIMLVAIFAAAVGEALAAKGMKAMPHEGAGFVQQIRAVIGDWHVLTGIAIMLVYVALYVYALGMADLSFALPLSAASYLLGLLFSKFYLHEEIKPARWIGTLIIIAGVLVVGVFGQSQGSSQSEPAKASAK